MTNDEMARLWDYLVDLNKSTAKNTAELQEIPEKIKHEITKLQFKYASMLLFGLGAGYYYMIKNMLPKIIKQVIDCM